MRRYVQVGVPLVVGAILIVPMWLDRSPQSPASPASALLPLVRTLSGTLPAVAGSSLDGASFVASGLRGHVVVLTFWNPACPPCRREAPALVSAWRALRSAGARFVGVLYVGATWPDDRSAARAFEERYGIEWPVMVDDGSELARALAIPGIPVTVLADARGRLRYEIVGGVKAGQIQSLVERLT